MLLAVAGPVRWTRRLAGGAPRAAPAAAGATLVVVFALFVWGLTGSDRSGLRESDRTFARLIAERVGPGGVRSGG